MKRTLPMLGALAAIPAISIVPVFLASFSFVLARAIIPPCAVPTSYHIARMHWIAFRGEMGWNGEIEQAVEHLKQCRSDRRSLAERLLSDTNGTIVSLGMDLVVQESFDDGDYMLMQFYDDKRWNHNVTLNDEYSQLLLAIWKTKRDIPVSAQGREVMDRWPDEYFEKFGVKSPSKLHF